MRRTFILALAVGAAMGAAAGLSVHAAGVLQPAGSPPAPAPAPEGERPGLPPSLVPPRVDAPLGTPPGIGAPENVGGARRMETPMDVYTLADVAFLAGAWESERGGTYMEEHWSEAYGDSMMGMFRWVHPGGKAALFEILTITQEAEGVILRLRHYTPTLEAKEDKDKPMTLRLTEVEGARAKFAALRDAGDADHVIYERTDGETLLFSLMYPAESGKPPLRLAFKRKGAAAAPGAQAPGGERPRGAPGER